MKFAFIDMEKAHMSLSRLCAFAGVSISGYYAWKHRLPSRRQLDDMIILAHIRNQFELSRETYGSPRMYVELNEEGIRAGRHRTARLSAKKTILKPGRKRASNAQPTAIMVNPSLPIFWIRTLPVMDRIRNGVSISVTYGPPKAGYIWQSLSIFILVASSAGKRGIG